MRIFDEKLNRILSRLFVETVDDDHLNFSIIERVSRIIPLKHQQAWMKGLKWRPRTMNFKPSLNKTLQAVISGRRPLLYGWRDDIIKKATIDNGLDHIETKINNMIVSVGFRPENRDMAVLMMWGHRQSSMIVSVINGVLLAYPFEAIETWVSLQPWFKGSYEKLR